MKKLYIIGICFLLLGSKLSAQHRESQNIFDKLLWDDKMLNVMVDTRVDFQTEFRSSDLQSASFRAQTIKLWLVGEIIPGIRYRFRYRLNKPQTPLIRDNYGSNVDHAWIAFDAGKNFTFTVGRQSVQLGTYEYDYNGADIYQSTMVNGDFDLYKTGINVAYRFAGQVMNFQVVNSDAPQFASEEYKNKAIAMNLLWQGSLFNNVLNTRWGYGAFQHTKSKFYNWFTAGTQIHVGDFTTELDYFYGARNMDYSSVVSVDSLGNRYVQDQSVSVNIKYNFGKWRPFVKGIWSLRHDKDYDRDAYQMSGIQGVIEYYPFENPLIKNLRFHLAYAYGNTGFKGEFGSLTDQHTHTLLIGMRWLFKVK
ncbi:MAG: OprO/OprP family phosphate-selective porin [Bacteroidales bacterium]|jgi:hypothetical protein|nr:OprO/OprP family phosphate-selective porin [Bacteroidales bacterium]